MLMINVSFNANCTYVVENWIADKITVRERGEIDPCWGRLQMVSQGGLTA